MSCSFPPLWARAGRACGAAAYYNIDLFLYAAQGIDMHTVTLSPKFQVVIPQSVRQTMDLQPGSQWAVVQVGQGIQLMPVPTLVQLQRELKGCGADLPVEVDRF